MARRVSPANQDVLIAAIRRAVSQHPRCPARTVREACAGYTFEQIKRGLAMAVQTGALRSTGTKGRTRYTVRPPRLPADDDRARVSHVPLSAGEPAGRSAEPTDTTYPTAVDRPPAPHARIATVSALMIDGDSDLTQLRPVESIHLAFGHADEQAELDAEPSIVSAPARYKPGHRIAEPVSANATGDAPWWASTDPRVWDANLRRQREHPTRMKVPGEDNIIAMHGAY